MTDKPHQEDHENIISLHDDSPSEVSPSTGEVAGSAQTPPAETPVDTADIYGISTPEEVSHPGTSVASPFLTRDNQEKSPTADDHLTDTSSDDFSEDENEPLSLDDLYERKRRERLDRSEEAGPIDPLPERRPLPLHPFVTGIMTPFFRSTFALRLLIMVAAGFFPLYLATLFFSHMLMNKYLEEGYKLAHFLNGIWDDKNILFLFCFLWGVFSIPHSLYVFGATAEGDDEMEEWPELNFIGGFGQFLWLVLLILIGGTPGYFVGLILGNPGAGFIISTLFFTPILFLSCMETDTLFTLITPSITRSLFVLWNGWLLFYAASAILFLATVAAGVFILWGIQLFQCSGWIVLAATIAVTALFSLAPIVYLRLLGRLGWMIAQERRLNPPPEKDDSDDKNSRWENVAETFRKFH